MYISKYNGSKVKQMTHYAELAVTTNFSFLRAASHPAELVATAEALGLSAIGIADRNSFAGMVRAFEEWKKRKAVRLLVGTRLVTHDGFEVLAYPTDRKAYGRLCRLLTQGNLKAKKGACHITFEDIVAASEGQMLIALPGEELSFPRKREPIIRDLAKMAYGSQLSPGRPAPVHFTDRLAALAQAAPGRCFLAGVYHYRGDEPRRLGLLAELGEHTGAPLVAVNDVHYHVQERRVLADVLTCIREKCTVRTPASGSRSMRSAISRRRTRWRGCSRAIPTRSHAAWRSPTPARFRSSS